MKLQKEIQNVWLAEVDAFGFTEVCKEANVNYRTLKRAIDGGDIKPYIYDTINSALVKLRKKRDSIEKKLILP